MANELDGKVAIVTGASSGIGETTSEALAAESATVVAASRREERLTGLKERMQDNGGRLEVVRADVTDEGRRTTSCGGRRTSSGVWTSWSTTPA